MATYTGTSSNDLADWTSQWLASGQTGHLMLGLAGDDYLIGGSKASIGGAYIGTTIDGGDGDDTLVGQSGEDVVIGGTGYDFLVGGADADLLAGGIGNDTLFGGTGNNDRISGGTGDDTYVVYLGSDGLDLINDDMSASWTTGSGGGSADKIVFDDTNLIDLVVARDGNDLLVSTIQDYQADSQWNQFVRIEDHYLAGNNVIENFETADYGFATTGFSAVPSDAQFYWAEYFL